MRLLGAKLYDPSTAGSASTASLLAMTAIDTTNLRISFTVPSHGMVRVKAHCIVHGATTFPTILLGVLEGSTVRCRVSPVKSLGNTAVATAQVSQDIDVIVTGLTPGAVNWDLAYGVEVTIASTAIKWGGPNNTTTNDAFGAITFEVWDPDPWGASPMPVNVTQVGGSSVDATSGILNVNVKQISGDATAADNEEAFFDGTGYAGTNNVIPTVTTLTNLPAITANWLTAAGIAASALNGKGDWNIGKTGYALSSAGVQSIWDTLTSALTTVGSIGKLLADNINTTISSRSSHSAADVWAAGTRTLTSFGTLAQDIWDKATSALTTVGSIGKLLVDNINATISSRSTLDMAGVRSAVGLASANLDTQLSGIQSDTNDIQSRIPIALSGDGFMKADLKSIEDELTSGNNATLRLKNIDIVYNNSTAPALFVRADNDQAVQFTSDTFDGMGIYGGLNGNGLTVAGSGTGKSINVPQDIALPSGDLEDQLQAIDNFIDTEVSAIKAKTDQLTFSLAGNLDVNLQSIDEQLTNGNNATLNLRRLSIVGGATSPVSIIAGAGSGVAVNVQSADAGSPAISLIGSQGPGLQIESQGNSSPGVNIIGDLHGINVEASSGKSINALNNIAVSDGDLTLGNIAKKVLTLDWTTVTGEANRSTLNALRKLRNRVYRDGSNLKTTKEDDNTVAYTQAIVTDPTQQPFKEVG